MSAQDAILAVNSGSSSLKFALYPRQHGQVDVARLSGSVEGLEPGGSARMSVCIDGVERCSELPASDGERFEQALDALRLVLDAHADDLRVVAVAHRIVHGGERYATSVLLDAEVLSYLETLAPLAPLHQPHNLDGVRAFQRRRPDLPQVGCFDTAFHTTLGVLEQMFALPQALRAVGIRRYGFHGLSYRYVAGVLARLSTRSQDKVLIAHLGNGASVCAMQDGVSVATSMGFSALDGLMMGTRSGALDPGVLLHLLRQGWDRARIENMLYSESGLRGVSGLSADMRTLRASAAPEAALAIALFEYRLLKECGALSAALGGLDVLAFTGGIGEHDAALRLSVCARLHYLGVRIDPQRNRAATGTQAMAIHADDSAVELWVVPTDEGRIAADDAAHLCP